MKPERWQQVREVLHEAMQMDDEERSAFLDSQCATDPSLRAELNELLAAEGEIGSSFLEKPAVVHASEHTDTSERAAVLPPGTKLGPYVVQSLIGAGGMGEVYRARDASLKRDVAIKVLPPSLSRDPDRLRRFELEAQATAALNHPNILSIFHIGQQDGSPYIVTELLEGETLRDRLRRGALQWREALNVALSTAKGLAAAHDQGIVHRDLKPENLFVTKDGRVKILDFGLAKLRQPKESAGPPPTLTEITEPGAVMGTAGYMSPEQVRGQAADPRSDIFAFGTILYEMVTGNQTFRKPTSAETMTAILNEKPPSISQLAPSTPPGLQRVVHRCLEKDPEKRFHSAHDLAFALEALTDPGISSVPSTKSRRKQLSGAVAAVIIATAVMAFAFRFGLFQRRKAGPAAGSSWVQVTNLVDFATSPALSPDGRMIAFIRGPETFVSPGQIYVKQLPDGQPVQLTHDDLTKMAPAFSPDGSRIAYTATDSSGGWNTWVVPVLGGEPQETLPNAAALTWIDAGHVMFSEIKTGAPMAIVTAAESRAGERDIYVPAYEWGMAHRSWLSPDGKWVLVSEMGKGGFGHSSWMPCRIVPFDGSSAGESTGPQRGACTYAGWSPDGDWLYFSVDVGEGFHLWRQRFPKRAPEQITFGPTEEEGIAVAPDGKSLVTSVGIRQESVWLHDAGGDRQISSESLGRVPGLGYNGGTAHSVFSPDGKKLFYVARKEGSRDWFAEELWTADLESGRTERVFSGVLMNDFDLSPDGRRVAFTTFNRESGSRVWLASLDHNVAPQQLASFESDRPSFGSTGDLFFRGREGNSEFVYVMQQNEVNPRKMSHNANHGYRDYKIMSPDAKWVLSGGFNSMALSTGGGPTVRICDFCQAGWDPGGKHLYMRFRGMGPMGGGKVYVIALPAGQSFPKLPPEGIKSAEDLKGQNVVAVVDMTGKSTFAPGPTPATYAYTRVTVQRNLFRIPLD